MGLGVGEPGEESLYDDVLLLAFTEGYFETPLKPLRKEAKAMTKFRWLAVLLAVSVALNLGLAGSLPGSCSLVPVAAAA